MITTNKKRRLYQINVDWNVDYVLLDLIEREITKYLEKARWYKRRRATIGPELNILRELISLKRQIKEHSDLNDW